MKLWQFAVVFSASLVASNEAFAGVIVVDAAGSGSFTQIQPAVLAALEGDTILIKPGNYATFDVSAKSLTIIGQQDPDVAASQVISADVRNLADGQVVTLARLRFAPSGFTRALEIDDCEGAVRVSQCVMLGWGVELDDSIDVAVTGCTMYGTDGWSGYTCLFDNVGPGLPCITGVGNNQLALYESVLQAGNGGNGGDSSYPGAHAVDVSGFVFASRSNLQGGDGGDACYYGCASNGGDGLHFSSGSGGWISDCMSGGGTAGTNENWKECPTTAAGSGHSGVAFTFQAASIGLSIPSIATEGTFVQVTFTGPPGAKVFLNDELTTTFVALASWRGVLISPFPESPFGAARTRRFGTIPASGTLTASYRVPMLLPSEQAQTRFLQAYRIGANGITLGTFRTLTVLDSAF